MSPRASTKSSSARNPIIVFRNLRRLVRTGSGRQNQADAGEKFCEKPLSSDQPSSFSLTIGEEGDVPSEILKLGKSSRAGARGLKGEPVVSARRKVRFDESNAASVAIDGAHSTEGWCQKGDFDLYAPCRWLLVRPAKLSVTGCFAGSGVAASGRLSASFRRSSGGPTDAGIADEKAKR